MPEETRPKLQCLLPVESHSLCLVPSMMCDNMYDGLSASDAGQSLLSGLLPGVSHTDARGLLA